MRLSKIFTLSQIWSEVQDCASTHCLHFPILSAVQYAGVQKIPQYLLSFHPFFLDKNWQMTSLLKWVFWCWKHLAVQRKLVKHFSSNIFLRSKQQLLPSLVQFNLFWSKTHMTGSEGNDWESLDSRSSVYKITQTLVYLDRLGKSNN